MRTRYIAWRLGRAILTVAGVVTLVFLMVRMVPGDPVDAILGEQASEEARAELRERLHLDAPFLVQYARFVGDVVDGSLGVSFRQEREVSSLIGEVALPTAALAIAALLVAFGLALPLGILAASRRGSVWDRGASFVAVVGLAIPNIWLGPLLILAFAVQLRWLPLPGDDAMGLRGLVLPAITLGTALAAILTRQTRGATSEALARPFCLAARARGLSERAVLVRHALRNAWLPVMTVGAGQLGALLSGAVVVEKIFERPGLGALFLEAFFARDIPVVQGVVLVVAFTYVTVNLLLDLLYTVADPRVRLS